MNLQPAAPWMTGAQHLPREATRDRSTTSKWRYPSSLQPFGQTQLPGIWSGCLTICERMSKCSSNAGGCPPFSINLQRKVHPISPRKAASTVRKNTQTHTLKIDLKGLSAGTLMTFFWISSCAYLNPFSDPLLEASRNFGLSSETTTTPTRSLKS